MATRISNAVALAKCNAAVDLVDGGSGAGKLLLRTGAPPTNCEDADSGTLIATFTLPDPAFGNAADIAPGARATAGSIDPVNAAAASNAAEAKYFRVKDSDDVVIFQGTCTASGGGGQMTIDNMDIASGQEITITSLTYTQPET